MVIDIAVLDYVDGKVRLISCNVPADYDSYTIEAELESRGYDLDNIYYMTATNIELIDERSII